MSIKSENGIFSIETQDSLYQMKVDNYGVLTHLWYGLKTDCDMDYLISYHDTGFSGNIYDAGNDRRYSLDTLPLEYPAVGVGDYRTPAISVTLGNGAVALDLRFCAYHITKGKYSIPGMPCVYGDEKEAETLEIELMDTSSGIKVTLLYGVLYSKNIITRSVKIENTGNSDVVINKADSLCLDIPYGEWEWVHFPGRYAMERQVERVPVFHGIQEISSSRGSSSHQQNPAFVLCEKGCSETQGNCIGALLMYSGSFKAQIEMDQLNQVRAVMGINSDTFSWTLKKDEVFYTPEVIMSFSDKGLSDLSHNFHNVIRNNVCRGKYKLSQRPIVINNWEATYFEFNEEKIEKIALQASELGIDMMVLDDGWFGNRNSDETSLGDWVVNETKLHGGLSLLIEHINKIGMKFGLWIEPEMISEDSNLFRNHPEWVIHIPDRKPVRSRNQLVLDMSRPEVVDYIYNAISSILNENHIEYIKWDMNRSICDWYSDSLPSDRQSEMPHRYILGVYNLLERINSNYSDVLIEGCSGGGGRFDAGMLYYCPQIWCSDNTDAYNRTFIQYGTSFFYPLSCFGSHITSVPNHQTGRITALKARGIVAMAGNFGFELDPSLLNAEEKEEVKKLVDEYKELQPLIHNGLYYRLSNPYSDNCSVWEIVSKDKEKILIQGLVFRAECNSLRKRIRLCGLDNGNIYKADDGNIYTAKALMNGGILLPNVFGDETPVQLIFEKIR